MSERFKFSLSSMWLFVSVFTLILPVFCRPIRRRIPPAT